MRIFVAILVLWLMQSCGSSRPQSQTFHQALGQNTLEAKLCDGFTNPSAIGDEPIYSGIMATPDVRSSLNTAFASVASNFGPCMSVRLLTQSPVDRGKKAIAFKFENGREMAFALKTIDGTIALLKSQGLLPQDGSLRKQTESVRLSDGTTLETHIFLPDMDGSFPIVLQRTPYLKHDEQFQYAAFYQAARHYTDQGYGFVIQGIKGTPGSTGKYKIFTPSEVDDAQETLDWLASQDFANGKVVVTGTSYDGFTALAAGVTNHPTLKAVFAGGSPVRLYGDAFTFNGSMLTALLPYMKYKVLQQGMPSPDDTFLTRLESLRQEPDLTRYDNRLFGQNLGEWDEIARSLNDPLSPIWHARSIKERLSDIEVPTFHIAGTGMDGDNRDVVSNFKIIEDHSSMLANHRLILGPWDHGNSTLYYSGGRSVLSPFMTQRLDSLLAHFLRGEVSPYMDEPRVQLVKANGVDAIGGDRWPLPQLRKDTAYLTGTGTASNTPSMANGSTTYNFLPTVVADQGNQSTKFLLQVPQSREVIGELTGKLHFVASRPVSDIYVFINILAADGSTRPFTTCPIGGKFFGASMVHVLNIEDCPLNVSLAAGDVVSIEVTSNMFPYFFRAREVTATGAFAFRNGLISVLHGPSHPSHLTWSYVE